MGDKFLDLWDEVRREIDRVSTAQPFQMTEAMERLLAAKGKMARYISSLGRTRP